MVGVLPRDNIDMDRAFSLARFLSTPSYRGRLFIRKNRIIQV